MALVKRWKKINIYGGYYYTFEPQARNPDKPGFYFKLRRGTLSLFETKTLLMKVNY